MRKQLFIPWLMLTPAIVILLALGLFPLVYSLWLSGHSYSLLDPSRGINYVGLKNFWTILVGKQVLGIDFFQSLKITGIFVAACLSIEIALGLGLAALFSRETANPSRSVEIFKLAVMIPMLLAPVVVGNIWRYMYQYSFGLLNFFLRLLNVATPYWVGDPSWALASLIIADVWEWAPFSFLVLIASIYTIPREQLEAASVDGAAPWQRFLHITLPWLKRALLVIILIRGIELIKNFDMVYTITYGGPGVATSLLSFNSYMLGFKYFEIGEAAAYAYLIVILVNAFVILFVNTLRRPRRIAS